MMKSLVNGGIEVGHHIGESWEDSKREHECSSNEVEERRMGEKEDPKGVKREVGSVCEEISIEKSNGWKRLEQSW